MQPDATRQFAPIDGHMELVVCLSASQAFLFQSPGTVNLGHIGACRVEMSMYFVTQLS